MKNINLSPALLMFGQFAFMVGVGAPWFFGDVLQVFSLLLGPLGIWLVFAHCKEITITKREWLLFSIFWIYYFYFSWREWASPYANPTVDFAREELVFFYAPFIILAFRTIDVEKSLLWMARILVPAMCIVFLVSMVQHEFYGISRVKFTTDNPLSLSLYMTSGVYISLALWRNQSRAFWVAAILAWLMGFVIILSFTQSRSASLLYLLCAMIFGAYVFLKLEYGWKENIKRLLLIGVTEFTLISVLIILLLTFDLAPRLEKMFDFIGSGQHMADRSSSYRWEMWTLFLEHRDSYPFFGIGPENPSAIVNEHWPFDQKFRHLHNDFFNHYAAGGIIGLLIYCALAFWPIGYLFSKSARDNRFIYILVMFFTVFFLSSLTNRVLFVAVRASWFVFAVMFLQIYFYQLQERRRMDAPTDWNAGVPG